jgi:hypothetical protein
MSTAQIRTAMRTTLGTLAASAAVTLTAIAAAIACLSLSGCGGGGDSSAAADSASAQDASATASQQSTAGGTSTATGPSLVQRIAAAKATAQSSTNPCSTIGPFYWEIGNAQSRITSGSVTRALDPRSYTDSSQINIASASKWIYSAYVVQKAALPLSQQTISFLHFTSGYTDFDRCYAWQTVQACDDAGSNGTYEAANDGKFYYNGGHMEKHATTIGLGGMDNTALAAEIRSQLGTDVNLSYSQPQLPGGVVTTPADYARFLRKMMDGSLKLGAMLGDDAVCTNPATCATAVYSPIPSTESPHYSLGHWVEDDYSASDGSYSSAGAFGFYPWIDKPKQFYGVVAREAMMEDGAGYNSALCGRVIRKAFNTGVVQ